ncbi:MAG: polysaccharide biosynthesis/export family protein [Cyclobacteriaceae bacterium]
MKYLQTNKSLTRIFIFGAFMTLLFASCVPLSETAYVQQEKSEDPSDNQYIGTQIDNIISSGDELYIRITSADEERTAFDHQEQARVSDPTLLSYTVSDDGTIKLPYIGKILVADITLEEASDKIEEALKQYLFIPSVYIRFINTKVTVLGEVRNPGVYMFNYKNINILQAIGYANEITEFGNRRNVLIIREEGIRRTRHFVDLTSDDLLESEWYLIKSDDIIYVEPLKRKKWGMATVPYNLILSVITTAIVVITFINTN